MDKAFNALLLKKDNAEQEMTQELSRLLNEPTEFLFNDYDPELFSEETRQRLLVQCKEQGFPGDNVDVLIQLFERDINSLSVRQSKSLAILCHASLLEKGKLMIEAYKKHVLPKLTDIEDVQKEITWTDEHGNPFVLVLDFRGKYNGHPVTADNKTSAPNVYSETSVQTSLQFAVYTTHTKIKAAAYFVLNKQIQKNRIKTCSICNNDGTGKRHKTCDAIRDGTRCDGAWNESIQPEALVEIWMDEVPTAEQAIAQSALTSVAEAVKKNSFPKNLKSCIQQWGRRKSKCPYYDYCRNGSTAGLEKKK